MDQVPGRKQMASMAISDDDSDGDSGGKNRKAKKTRFTHAVKGKGKSKV